MTFNDPEWPFQFSSVYELVRLMVLCCGFERQQQKADKALVADDMYIKYIFMGLLQKTRNKNMIISTVS